MADPTPARSRGRLRPHGARAHRSKERLDQAKYARTHLAIGYATLAAVGIAVGALVF